MITGTLAPRPFVRTVLILTAVSLAGWGCGGNGIERIAYVGGNIWTGSGAPPILDGVLVLAGNTIELIGPPDAVKVPRGATVRRVDGKWIVPGLIDAHAHTERWMLDRFLAYGVTSVRDMGGAADSVTLLERLTSLGDITGPRLFISRAMIDGPGALESATRVRSGEQARRAVDRLSLAEVSQVKIGYHITRRLLKPLMDEARTLELPVAAHLGKVDALTAARLGIASLEHMSGVPAAASRDPKPIYRAYSDELNGEVQDLKTWAALDSARLARVARRLAGEKIMIVPTLIAHRAAAHLGDASYRGALDLTGVPKAVQRQWHPAELARKAGITGKTVRTYDRAARRQALFIREFKRAGGHIAAGSDTPHPLLAPGASLLDEIELLVKAGLSTKDALLAATRDAARLVRSDSVGVLAQGHYADLVVLDANPLADISNLRAINFVVVRGTRIYPADLKQSW